MYPKRTNPRLREFAYADLLKARQMIRAGFELETQATNGLGANESEPDYERAHDLACSDWDDADALEAVRDYSEGFFARLDYFKARNVCRALFDTEYPSLEQLAKYDTDIDEDNIRDRYIDNRQEYIIDNWEEYSCGGGEPDFRIPEGMDWDEDESVSGFEFRTEGPKTYAEFLKAANAIFKQDHTIDEGCSFHIHMSLPGTVPVDSPEFVKNLTQYILDHASELPRSVQQRLRYGPQRFFEPKGESDGKYSFVQRHSLGTWEFRCFGNVKSPKSAAICLNMAIRAYQHAMRVRFGIPTDCTPYVTRGFSWHSAAATAMDEGKTMEQVQREALGEATEAA